MIPRPGTPDSRSNRSTVSVPDLDPLRRLRGADGSVLLIGDHLERIGQLTSELLNAGCRVEIARRSSLRSDAEQPERPHALVVVDGIGLAPRHAAELLEEAARTHENTSAIALVESRPTSARASSAPILIVTVRVRPDGLLAATGSVIRDIASAWASLQAISLPAGLEIERRRRSVTMAGVPVALADLEYRLLRALAESPGGTRSFPDLCRAIGRGRAAHDRRSGKAVRRAISRLDARLRSAGHRLEITSDELVRLHASGPPTTDTGS
ncbi:MAG TPA: hypothetical protein VJU87_00050 [Gemmatimonadaceae bacterium]|nr:hypothetical protein [Gemmatimonadaceae bacterium]